MPEAIGRFTPRERAARPCRQTQRFKAGKGSKAVLSKVGGVAGVFFCSMKHYWPVCMECASLAMGQDDATQEAES